MIRRNSCRILELYSIRGTSHTQELLMCFGHTKLNSSLQRLAMRYERFPFTIPSCPKCCCRNRRAGNVSSSCNLIVEKKRSALSASQLKFRLNFLLRMRFIVREKKIKGKRMENSGIITKVSPHIFGGKRKMMNRNRPNLTRQRPALRDEM